MGERRRRRGLIDWRLRGGGDGDLLGDRRRRGGGEGEGRLQ